MATVYKYRLYCSTEATYKYSWGTTEPTTCPTDTAHTIDSSQTTIIERVDSKEVKIKEETVVTQGEYMYETFKVPSTSATGSSANIIRQYPYPISIAIGRFISTVEMADDSFYIETPDTIVGTVTAATTATDTVINVSQTVVDNTKYGYFVRIDDATNDSGEIKVTAVDKTGLTITLESQVGYVFAIGTPVYLKVYFCKADCIGNAGIYETGSGLIGAKGIEANQTMRFRYENVTGGDKKVVLHMEYRY